jgi:hypothetical protein
MVEVRYRPLPSNHIPHKLWVGMWGLADMPKRHGAHPDRALATVKIRALSRPGRYADGNGSTSSSMIAMPSAGYCARWCGSVAATSGSEALNWSRLSKLARGHGPSARRRVLAGTLSKSVARRERCANVRGSRRSGP